MPSTQARGLRPLTTNLFDTIRPDTLLFLLAQFAEVPASPTHTSKGLPARFVRGVRALAATPQQNKRRPEIALLAERFGRSPKEVHVYMSRLRAGREPRNWGAIV